MPLPIMPNLHKKNPFNFFHLLISIFLYFAFYLLLFTLLFLPYSFFSQTFYLLFFRLSLTNWFMFSVNTYTQKGFFKVPTTIALLPNSIPLTWDRSFRQHQSWVELNHAWSMRAPTIKSAQGPHMAKSGPAHSAQSASLRTCWTIPTVNWWISASLNGGTTMSSFSFAWENLSSIC